MRHECEVCGKQLEDWEEGRCGRCMDKDCMMKVIPAVKVWFDLEQGG